MVDQANTASPVVYCVHTDHLGRPARMIAQNWSWAWDVIYSPFGGVSAIWTSPATQDMRFPGQWFQLESGLAYNWHRHYDATLGRYIQPDPLLNDRSGTTIGGISAEVLKPTAGIFDMLTVEANTKAFSALSEFYGRRAGHPIVPERVLFDGPSAFGYTGQNPVTKTDVTGLASVPYSSSPELSSPTQKCYANDNCYFMGLVYSGSVGVCLYKCLAGPFSHIARVPKPFGGDCPKL